MVVVVVVVVVVVELSGTVVVVVVVDVDVVVEVATVATVLSIGQDVVATTGRICRGGVFLGTDVDTDELLGFATSVVDVGDIVLGVIARASESAGATAGGSL